MILGNFGAGPTLAGQFGAEEEKKKRGLFGQIGNFLGKETNSGASRGQALGAMLASLSGNPGLQQAALSQISDARQLSQQRKQTEAESQKERQRIYAQADALGIPRAQFALLNEQQRAQITGRAFGLTGGVDDPSAVREYEYWQQLSPEDQAKYLEVKRNPQFSIETIRGVPTATERRPGGNVSQAPLSTLQDEALSGQTLREAEQYGAAVGGRAGEIAGEDLAPSDTARRAAQQSVTSRMQRVQLVSDAVNKAIEQTSKTNTGRLGRFVSAPNLDATLKTITANIGFDELQRLRDNSKTGGALGQVSNFEIGNLQAVLGDLGRSQNERQLDANLRRVDQQMNQSWRNIAEAYEADYGVPYEGAQPAAPAPQASPGDNVSFPNAPPIGTVREGHEYLGGDPSQPSSWRRL